MRNSLLYFWTDVFLGAKFSLETLRKHILFQVNYIHDLLLKVSEAVPKILIFITHSTVDLLLLLRYHEMEVVIA